MCDDKRLCFLKDYYYYFLNTAVVSACFVYYKYIQLCKKRFSFLFQQQAVYMQCNVICMLTCHLLSVLCVILNSSVSAFLSCCLSICLCYRQ